MTFGAQGGSSWLVCFLCRDAMASLQLGMKMVLEFFGFPKNVSELFQSDSPEMIFFENGIGNRYYIAELVSKSV
jgi:hypothetical protein